MPHPEPPLPANEIERLEALRRYKILDTMRLYQEAEHSLFEDLTRLAAEICGTPVALITLIEDTRAWFKCKVNFDLDETSRTVSFCSYAIMQPGLFVVPDAWADPRFAENPLVTGPPRIRFYAGSPLVTPDGFPVGTLCVIDTMPRELEPQQRESLRVLSEAVMSQLELWRKVAETARIATDRQGLMREVREALEAVRHQERRG